jgi:putative transposase
LNHNRPRGFCFCGTRRLKELEQEDAKLKRLVSELSLEKLVLKDIASGNF